MFVIYSHPADYPDDYVVRRWILPAGGAEPVADPEPLLISANLQACRELLQQKGLIAMRRWPHDDPKILETWI